MQPIDFRNETWADIQSRMSSERERVYNALKRHGDATTRALAAAMNEDIVNVRPRVTELCQLGAVEVVGRSGRHEGVYRARTIGDWTAWFTQQQHVALHGDQLLLGI